MKVRKGDERNSIHQTRTRCLCKHHSSVNLMKQRGLRGGALSVLLPVQALTFERLVRGEKSQQHIRRRSLQAGHGRTQVSSGQSRSGQVRSPRHWPPPLLRTNRPPAPPPPPPPPPPHPSNLLECSVAPTNKNGPVRSLAGQPLVLIKAGERKAAAAVTWCLGPAPGVRSKPAQDGRTVATAATGAGDQSSPSGVRRRRRRSVGLGDLSGASGLAPTDRYTGNTGEHLIRCGVSSGTARALQVDRSRGASQEWGRQEAWTAHAVHVSCG